MFNYKLTKENLQEKTYEELIEILLKCQDDIDDKENTISQLENEIDDLEIDILNLRNEIDEYNIPLSSQINESVIDYSSLINILDRDNFLNDTLRQELEYILKYHNNLQWVDDIR